jgi:subtilisin family serine protease
MTVVAAPGDNIYSLVPNNKYEFFQGSSMSSPIVAATVALLKSEYPGISNELIRNAMINSNVSGVSRLPYIWLPQIFEYLHQHQTIS